MPDDKSSSLNAATELSKQIMTLSSVLLGFTVTFADKFSRSGDQLLTVPMTLKLSWIAYFISILCAIWLLLSIAGSANELRSNANAGNIYRANIKIPAFASILMFLLAVCLTIWSGWYISLRGT
jgi:hypothetical protein